MRRFKYLPKWAKALIVLGFIGLIVGLFFLASYIASLFVDMTYVETLKFALTFGKVKPVTPVEPVTPIEPLVESVKMIA